MSEEAPQPQPESKPTEVEEKYDPYKKYKQYQCEDPDLYKNGPIGDESRKCRDILCCIIFILFLIGCVVVAVLGFVNGHPMKVIYPYDEDGNQCGGDGNYSDYKFIYFYNSVSNLKSLEVKSIVNGVCVKTCPNKTLESTDKEYFLDCIPTKNNTDCKVTSENYYRSAGLLERFCIPDITDPETEVDQTKEQKIKIYDSENNEIIEKVVPNDAVKTIDDKVYILYDSINGNGTAQDASNQLINWSFFSVDKLASWISDLYMTWPILLASLAWSFVLAMLFLLFVRCCAGFIIYTVIILILAGFIGLSLICHFKSDEYKQLGDTTYENALYALMWVFAALALIWFIIICLMCNRIRLAIKLIEITGKYINNNCCILIVPFVFFIIDIAWIAYWVVLSLFLYSSGDFDENSKVIATFVWTAKIRYSWWFHLFALFYMDAIFSAFGDFVYASAASIWYFTNEKGTEDSPICKSVYRGFRFHFGSLAFGSLIIAIIRFIMVALEIFKQKVEETLGGKKSNISCCYKCVIGCLECCLNCIQRTMEFINRHAYIEIALKGQSFCTAAWEGFALMVKNLGRFSSLILLGNIFSIFGTLFISIVSGIIGYFVITEVESINEKLNSIVLPVVIMIIIGFIIGIISMDVFGMSSDALMHAFLMDEELNKGQSSAMPELQQFMSEER